MSNLADRKVITAAGAKAIAAAAEAEANGQGWAVSIAIVDAGGHLRHDKVWICTGEEIARHWMAVHPYRAAT